MYANIGDVRKNYCNLVGAKSKKNALGRKYGLQLQIKSILYLLIIQLPQLSVLFFIDSPVKLEESVSSTRINQSI